MNRLPFNQISWDSRKVVRPNIFPGDVIARQLGQNKLFYLVVHSSESSAKVIQVGESSLENPNHAFQADTPGEIWSSYVEYNTDHNFVKAGTIPEARIVKRESASTRVKSREEMLDGASYVYVPTLIGLSNDKVKAATKARKSALSSPRAVQSAIDEGAEDATELFLHHR